MWENAGVLIFSEGRSTNLIYHVFSNMFTNVWAGKEEIGWTETGIDVHTLQCIKQIADGTDRTAQGLGLVPCSDLSGKESQSQSGPMDVCDCSLCCTAETNMTL